MSKIKVAITTGDVDGIGLEVTAKALCKIGPQREVQFVMWRSQDANSKYLKTIDQKFKRITVDSPDQALKIDGPYLIDIESDISPAKWVEQAAILCNKGRLNALVTAPLSKLTIHEAGLRDLGHTDVLKRISKTHHVNMGFVGNKFNVVLATGHVPVSKITKHISFKSVAESLLNANSLRLSLDSGTRKKPIAVLGLNPHAGEKGLIGQDELLIFPHLREFAKENSIPIEGPLVPDAAFFESNWKKYSIYLALYHDQGLIPFKMVHGQDSGVHISLGLPFIRTSVDHGTAKDIFGKNIANPNSMLDAIRWGIKFARLKK